MLLTDLKAMKCKTCGESLDIGKAQGGVIKCAICDSCFTLPKVDASQKVLDFLSQGEHDLDTCRFEDAYSAFNKACELDKTEPEAYWGMALAEFKIQYLKDEVNNRLQPICHEISDKDFADSSNFLKAIRYATDEQRKEYEKKSEEINYIKNEFYKIAKTGAKYDCFICVKVTDENGGRTQDYKHADDIYFELKGKGYKPFFSERELVGVTGADYEARILYALKSSECMLVICFDEAYLRTKWVKNEYTRFLKLVNDEEKESDSIALVFGNRPVEKLPGKKGKIQGIALNSLTAMERIVQFVDSHTPEARKRREEAQRKKEEEAKRKAKEDELLRKRFAEQEERARQQEELMRQQEEIIRQLQEQMKNQAQSLPATGLSDEELFERMERARQEKERKEREEAERKAKEESERKESEAREAAERERKQEEKERQEREKIEREKREAEEKARLKAEKERQERERKEREEAEKKAREERERKLARARAREEEERKRLQSYRAEVNKIATKYQVTFEEAEQIKKDFQIDGDELTKCITSVKTEVVIPNGVKSIRTGAFNLCRGLKKIIIPQSVIEVGSYIGYGIDLTICCEAKSKPRGWDKDWDKKEVRFRGDRHKVVWGYKGD